MTGKSAIILGAETFYFAVVTFRKCLFSGVFRISRTEYPVFKGKGVEGEGWPAGAGRKPPNFPVWGRAASDPGWPFQEPLCAGERNDPLMN